MRVQAAAQQAVKTPEKFIPPWRDCFGLLQQKGLRTVAPEEAQEMLATADWVLVDVRCVSVAACMGLCWSQQRTCMRLQACLGLLG